MILQTRPGKPLSVSLNFKVSDRYAFRVACAVSLSLFLSLQPRTMPWQSWHTHIYYILHIAIYGAVMRAQKQLPSYCCNANIKLRPIRTYAMRLWPYVSPLSLSVSIPNMMLYPPASIGYIYRCHFLCPLPIMLQLLTFTTPTPYL